MDRTNVAEIFENLAKAAGGTEHHIYATFAYAFGDGQRDLDDIIEEAKDVCLYIDSQDRAAGKAALAILRVAEAAGVR